MSDNRTKEEIKQAMREAADFFTPFVEKSGRLNATKVLTYIERIDRERDEARDDYGVAQHAREGLRARIAELEAENARLSDLLCGRTEREGNAIDAVRKP